VLVRQGRLIEQVVDIPLLRRRHRRFTGRGRRHRRCRARGGFSPGGSGLHGTGGRGWILGDRVGGQAGAGLFHVACGGGVGLWRGLGFGDGFGFVGGRPLRSGVRRRFGGRFAIRNGRFGRRRIGGRIRNGRRLLVRGGYLRRRRRDGRRRILGAHGHDPGAGPSPPLRAVVAVLARANGAVRRAEPVAAGSEVATVFPASPDAAFTTDVGAGGNHGVVHDRLLPRRRCGPRAVRFGSGTCGAEQGDAAGDEHPRDTARPDMAASRRHGGDDSGWRKDGRLTGGRRQALPNPQPRNIPPIVREGPPTLACRRQKIGAGNAVAGRGIWGPGPWSGQPRDGW